MHGHLCWLIASNAYAVRWKLDTRADYRLIEVENFAGLFEERTDRGPPLLDPLRVAEHLDVILDLPPQHDHSEAARLFHALAQFHADAALGFVEYPFADA